MGKLSLLFWILDLGFWILDFNNGCVFLDCVACLSSCNEAYKFYILDLTISRLKIDDKKEILS